MTDRSFEQPPGGVPEKTSRQDEQQHLTERLVLDGGERAVLVGPLVAAERHLGRQHTDGQPDHAAGDQEVAQRAETVGPVTLDRMVDEAKLSGNARRIFGFTTSSTPLMATRPMNPTSSSLSASGVL